jgi:hypothetical protein
MKRKFHVLFLMVLGAYLMAPDCEEFELNEDLEQYALDQLKCKDNESQACVCPGDNPNTPSGLQFCAPGGGTWEACLCPPECTPVQETCDGVDNDCDGRTDEGAADAPTWYADRDGDGHGNGNEIWISCEPPSGYVERNDDLDDLCSRCWDDCSAPCDPTESSDEPDTDTQIDSDTEQDTGSEIDSDTGTIVDTASDSDTGVDSDTGTGATPDFRVSSKYEDEGTQWFKVLTKIVNNTNIAVPLTQLEMRYYFRADNNYSGFVVECWGSCFAYGDIVSVTPSHPEADYYLRLRFSSETLPAYGETQWLSFGVRYENWVNCDQTNDWSFIDTAENTELNDSNGFRENPKITLWRGGVLVWGDVPN